MKKQKRNLSKLFAILMGASVAFPSSSIASTDEACSKTDFNPFTLVQNSLEITEFLGVLSKVLATASYIENIQAFCKSTKNSQDMFSDLWIKYDPRQPSTRSTGRSEKEQIELATQIQSRLGLRCGVTDPQKKPILYHCHQNRDGSYALFPDSVRISQPEKVYIDPQSHLCGDIKINGEAHLEGPVIIAGDYIEIDGKFRAFGDRGEVSILGSNIVLSGDNLVVGPAKVRSLYIPEKTKKPELLIKGKSVIGLNGDVGGPADLTNVQIYYHGQVGSVHEYGKWEDYQDKIGTVSSGKIRNALFGNPRAELKNTLVSVSSGGFNLENYRNEKVSYDKVVRIPTLLSSLQGTSYYTASVTGTPKIDGEKNLITIHGKVENDTKIVGETPKIVIGPLVTVSSGTYKKDSHLSSIPFTLNSVSNLAPVIVNPIREKFGYPLNPDDMNFHFYCLRQVKGKGDSNDSRENPYKRGWDPNQFQKWIDDCESGSLLVHGIANGKKGFLKFQADKATGKIQHIE